MNYGKYINFNWNKTELKDNNSSIKMILHAIDNTKRKDDRELLNPNPELKNKALIKTDIEKVKQELEETKNLKKGGKGAKPYRFVVSTLNVEPTKANEEIINEWANEMLKMYKKYFNVEGAYLHLNETRPHIHIVCKNFNKEKWGNFVNGKEVKQSGDQGEKILRAIWKEGEQINRAIAKKYKLEFLQDATTEKGQDRTINSFRKKLEKGEIKPEEAKKIIEIFKAKGLMKEPKTEKPDKLLEHIMNENHRLGEENYQLRTKINAMNYRQENKTSEENYLISYILNITQSNNINQAIQVLQEIMKDYDNLLKQQNNELEQQERRSRGRSI